LLVYISTDTQIATSHDWNKIVEEATEWAERVLVQVSCSYAALDIQALNTDITCSLYRGGAEIARIILGKGDSK